MIPRKQIAMVIAGLVMACSTSCNTNDRNAEVYYLIAANVQLPYWQSVANGFN